MKLTAPYVARGRVTSSPFNEGVEVPDADWKRITTKNPELVSRDVETRSRAMKKAITKGELAKYRRR